MGRESSYEFSSEFSILKTKQEHKMLKIPKILQCQCSTDSASSGSD